MSVILCPFQFCLLEANGLSIMLWISFFLPNLIKKKKKDSLIIEVKQWYFSLIKHRPIF